MDPQPTEEFMKAITPHPSFTRVKVAQPKPAKPEKAKPAKPSKPKATKKKASPISGIANKLKPKPKAAKKGKKE